MATILSSLLTFSTSHELVYGRQEENQTGTIDMSQELQMNLTLGKPLYTEKFIVPQSVNVNSTNPAFSFSGSGILNG